MSVRGVHGTAGPAVAPMSIAGRWAVGLFLAFVVAIAVFVTVTSLGAGSWESGFFANLEVTIPLLVAAASAAASLVSGVVAVIKAGDRSAAVLLVTGLSGMITLFFVGELLSVIGVLPQH